MKFPSTERLAGFSARHPWWVVGIWVLFLVLAIVAAPGLESALTGDEMKLQNNPDSVKGQTLLSQEMTGTADFSETVLVRSDTATVDDPAFQQRVEEVQAALLAQNGVVAQVFTYYQAALFRPEAAEAIRPSRVQAAVRG